MFTGQNHQAGEMMDRAMPGNREALAVGSLGASAKAQFYERLLSQGLKALLPRLKLGASTKKAPSLFRRLFEPIDSFPTFSRDTNPQSQTCTDARPDQRIPQFACGRASHSATGSVTRKPAGMNTVRSLPREECLFWGARS
jgi:hypothetical protein